ncbi:MAG TPA: cupin domain-containing protein [Rhodocyclaceae bacterium]|nr:cupin domain-containing protein [Rhodocyclaceae bacterium]
MPSLNVFHQQHPEPVLDRPRSERLVRGNPQRLTWNHFTSRSGEVSAGLWACEPGAWHIAFATNKDEFFTVLEGRIRITDAEGVAREVGPGEAAVIPAGFTGIFEVLEAVRKYYVVVERG